jgi:transcriptional regulator with XRE-family HTH domain
MTHDPEVWAVLGRAIRSDRERQGLTRAELATRVGVRGGSVTPRSIGSLESGVVPKKRAKPPTLEPVVAALGWKPGWVDRILSGEDPSEVLGQAQASIPERGPRSHLLELLPYVYDFGRTAVAAGAPTEMRDRLERLVRDVLDAVPGSAPAPSAYALAAYRPHAEGEGVPTDDAARIFGAIERNA